MYRMAEAPMLGRALLWSGLVLLVGLFALAGHVAAASTSTCDIRKDGRKLGTTYVTSLKVTHVSCTTAKRVVKAFNACRRANGGVKGHCETRVRGYRCTERRGDTIPTQYSAKVTCARSPRVIRFNYTQYT
jgi:hypothetical protein